MIAGLAPVTLLVTAAFQGHARSGGFMRSCLFWLLGVPIPIIIIVWLITGHA